MDIRLFYHYTTVVWKTIVAAGISNEDIWAKDVPEMAFEYPFLMHAVLTFSANHFSRAHRTEFENDPAAIEQVVTFHRGDALKLLGEAVRNVTQENLDALVASSILLILDSMANASPPNTSSRASLPASAWLHHVRGAATILTAVGPPSKESRFFRLVNVDLSDLALGLMSANSGKSEPEPSAALECFDDDLRDLYPVNPSSPYFHALGYLDKLFRQRYKSDFILRVFSFPALLDKNLVQMLITGDTWAKRIIRVYYKLVRSFTSEMKESVWFLEGVAKILPIDMDEEFGGLGFITQALPLNLPSVDELMATFFGPGEGPQQAAAAIASMAAMNSKGILGSEMSNSDDFSGLSTSGLEGISTDGQHYHQASGSGNMLAGIDLDSLGTSDIASFASEYMIRAASSISNSQSGTNPGSSSSNTQYNSTSELVNSISSIVGSRKLNNTEQRSLSDTNSIPDRKPPIDLLALMGQVNSSNQGHDSIASIGGANNSNDQRQAMIDEILGAIRAHAENTDGNNSSINEQLQFDRMRFVGDGEFQDHDQNTLRQPQHTTNSMDDINLNMNLLMTNQHLLQNFQNKNQINTLNDTSDFSQNNDTGDDTFDTIKPSLLNPNQHM